MEQRRHLPDEELIHIRVCNIDIDIEIATLQLGTLTQIFPAVLVHHLPHHLVGLLVPAHIRQDDRFYVLIFSTSPKPQFSAELGSTLITGGPGPVINLHKRGG